MTAKLMAAAMLENGSEVYCRPQIQNNKSLKKSIVFTSNDSKFTCRVVSNKETGIQIVLRDQSETDAATCCGKRVRGAF